MKDLFIGFLAGCLFCGLLYVFHVAVVAVIKKEVTKLHDRLVGLEAKLQPVYTVTASTSGYSQLVGTQVSASGSGTAPNAQ